MNSILYEIQVFLIVLAYLLEQQMVMVILPVVLVRRTTGDITVLTRTVLKQIFSRRINHFQQIYTCYTPEYRYHLDCQEEL